jgi:hypothetical protein
LGDISWKFKHSTKNFAGAGTQTAGLAFGGYDGTPTYTGATEEYNGSTWTTVPPGLNTARTALAGAGTQTAGLAMGGEAPGSGPTAATEEYNGSTWTNSNSLNTPRGQLAGCGTQTAGLAFGGEPAPTSGSSNRRI